MKLFFPVLLLLFLSTHSAVVRHRRKHLNKHKKHHRKLAMLQTTGDCTVSGKPNQYKTDYKANLKPLNIQFKIPVKFAKKNEQMPLVVIPQIIVPRKKQKYYVHHNQNMGQYYDKMLHTMNPYYYSLMDQNPYWQDYMSSPAAMYFQNLISENPEYDEINAHLMKKLGAA